MTTTLRPSGPERTGEHGGWERPYAICVNGREVGGVTVGTTSDGRGWINDLAVEPQGRGRGRGTTAVLAAEEILRSWGCTRVGGSVSASVSGEDGAAVGGGDGLVAQRVLRWTQSLGYELTARNMVKELPVTPPELAPGLTGQPLPAQDFPAWLAAESAGYVAMLIERTGLTPEQAAAKSAADHAALLPQGQDTPGVSITRLLAAGEPVGAIWVNTFEAGERPAWVYDVEVAEGHRGHGYGRALMLLAERVTLAAGVPRLALNVHAGNVPAERLYESLGYRTYRWVVAKNL